MLLEGKTYAFTTPNHRF